MRVFLILAFVCSSVSAASLRNSDTSEEPRLLNGLAETFVTDIKGVIKTETYRESVDAQQVATDPLALLLKPRVVGESVIAPGAYPFFCRVDNSFFPSCGGSLVAPDVVLTSADCMSEDKTDLTVLVNGEGGRPSTRFRKVVDMVVHPNYSSESFYNDLMLLKLNEPVEGVPVVELNRDSGIPTKSDEVTVMGLGALFGGRGYPDVLQSVEVDTIGNEFCSAAYQDIGLPAVDDDIMFCAGKRYGGTDNACHINSGSPVLNKDGIQVGVTSHGLGCRSREEFPAIYARTAVRNGEDWLGKSLCDMTDTRALQSWCSKPIVQSITPKISNPSAQSMKPINSNLPTQSRTPTNSNLPGESSTVKETVEAAPTKPEESPSEVAPEANAVKECVDDPGTVTFKKKALTCEWLTARPKEWKRACKEGEDAYVKCQKMCAAAAEELGITYSC